MMERQRPFLKIVLALSILVLYVLLVLMHQEIRAMRREVIATVNTTLATEVADFKMRQSVNKRLLEEIRDRQGCK